MANLPRRMLPTADERAAVLARRALVGGLGGSSRRVGAVAPTRGGSPAKSIPAGGLRFFEQPDDPLEAHRGDTWIDTDAAPNAVYIPATGSPQEQVAGADSFTGAAVVTIPVDDDTYQSPAVYNGSFGVEAGEPEPLAFKTAWFVYRPLTSGTATVHATSQPAYGLIATVYTGASLGALSVEEADTDGVVDFTVAVTGGVTYYIQLGVLDDANLARYLLDVTGPASVPSVSTGDTLFGACPGPSGGVAAIDAKYGTVPVVRIFNGASLALPSGCSGKTVVLSFKMNVYNVANGSLDATIIAGLNSVGESGQDIYLCLYHEPEDNIERYERGNTSSDPFPLATYRAATARLISLLAQANPVANIFITQILMAWTFDSRSGRDPLDYLVAGTAVLGVDFDGDAPTSATTYPMFAPAMAAVPGFAAAHGLAVGVAEFSSARASGDSDGSLKAAWETSMAGDFVSELAALWVCYFDYPDVGGPTEPNLTSAEIAAWSALVAG